MTAARAAPWLSVVIPTYNRADRLRATLESLERQALPPSEFEVIVVVDGSTDGTQEMLAAMRTPYRLTVMTQENSGQNVGRNRGVEAARGHYLVFIDDDIIASPSLLVEHLRTQREHGGVVGLGTIEMTIWPNADWFAREFAESWNGQYASLLAGERQATWKICYGGNVSVPRDAFVASGGFAPDMRRGHDVELGYRLAVRGLRFFFIASATGIQDERKGVSELVCDFEKYGIAAVAIYRRHPATLQDVIQPFHARGAGPIWLRRLFLWLGVPPRALAVAGAIVPGVRRRRGWYRFVQRYCYWRGVRRAIGNAEAWEQLTRRTLALPPDAVVQRAS
jgi:glycosyltransferase involved in cell wall biosynthesis